MEITPVFVIEWTAAAFGVVSVWLTVRQNILAWPIGVVNVALYVYVFYHAKLYLDATLQAIYVPLQLYGWWQWLHGGAERTELHVGRTPAALRPLLIALGVTGTLGLGWFFGTKTDAAMPYWDAGITSFSVVAQWMMAKKLLENWLVWIAVDFIATGVFFVKGLYPTTVLYVVFLCMAVAGYVHWQQSERKQQASPA